MKQVFKVILGLLILFTSIIHAEVYIEINKGINLARPIGVVPFQWSYPDLIPENISEIIASDLRNSGKFKPLDIFQLPQYPSTAAEVIPTSWTVLGIDSIIIGKVQPDADNNYMVSYQLIDTSSNNPGAILSQNQLKAPREWLRWLAHTISDESFEKLTNIRGAFRTRIAYVVQIINSRQFFYELRVADYDGYNQVPVYRSTQPIMSPSWSPDGSKLAYVSFDSGHSELIIQTLDSGDTSRVTNFPQHNGAPVFSPDGNKLAFVLSNIGSLNLYFMDIKSGYIYQVTNNRNNNTEPTWFPDSKTLAYTSDQSGYPQIYKININGGIPQRLSWVGKQNQNAKVSSDGKFLVMVSINNNTQCISKLDLETGIVQVLTDNFLDETPSIAPNDTMIIYSSSRGMNSVLRLVSIDGCFKANFLENNKLIKFPAWSPYL